MKLSPTAIVLAASLALASGPSLAGPFQDFENQARTAYGAYRAALFSTNTGNVEKSVATVEKFSKGWSGLASKWSTNPPPQYSTDAAFAKDMKEIAAIAGKALSQAKTGDLKTSHVTLERIRDMLADLRRRNGVISYSDHVNAYHEHMEHVLRARYAGDKNRLAVDAGVLAYLAKRLETEAPAAYRQNTDFTKALGAVNASVTAFSKAVAGGDVNAIAAARKMLKKPYAKLFVRWG
jgi:inorganic triphosphatase YgiF